MSTHLTLELRRFHCGCVGVRLPNATEDFNALIFDSCHGDRGYGAQARGIRDIDVSAPLPIEEALTLFAKIDRLAQDGYNYRELRGQLKFMLRDDIQGR